MARTTKQKYANLAFSQLMEGHRFRPGHVVEVGAYNLHYCNFGPLLDEPQCRVELIEPQPKLAAELKRGAEKLPNVTVLQCAIVENAGPVTLLLKGAGTHVEGVAAPEVVNPRSRWNRQPRARKKGVKKLVVPGIRFDSIDDGTIDALSLDSEGSEWWAIKFMKSRPGWISIEMGDEANPYWNPHLEEIEGWMKAEGYQRCARVAGAGRDHIYRRR